MNMLLLALVLFAALAASVAAALSWAALRKAGAPAETPRALADKLLLIETALQAQPTHFREELKSLRETSDTRSAALRDELRSSVAGFQTALEGRFGAVGEEQKTAAAHLRKELTDGQIAAANAVERSTKSFSDFQRERLDRMETAQKAGLDAVAGQLKEVRDGASAEAAKARETLTAQLDQLRKENEAKLEQMRATVDEKLQGALEQRLGESFKLVSERLDTVHKGLGEMQQLATGVGDLKRVLTNVKSRGTWGEVQLGALLEDMLTPEQYAAQVRVQPDRGEVVDFAVHMPNGPDGRPLLLPIDCKFPHEDYDRLLAAQESGDPAAVEVAGKALERAVRLQAKSINEKYVHPPASTNFAIMYLPTEGLFAEVVRRPGLVQDLQQTCRVTVTGPTTLAALLNSLRMGFTTLAIQKRSSEVWTVLGEAKKAFIDYGAAFEAVDKKLDEAKRKVAEVGVKHRAVTRKLRGVESAEALPESGERPKLLALAGLPEDEEAA